MDARRAADADPDDQDWLAGLSLWEPSEGKGALGKIARGTASLDVVK